MFDEIAFRNDTLEVRRRVVGNLDNNIYVVVCRQTNDKIAIDASSPDVMGSTRVLITHGHHDHVTAASELHDGNTVLYLGPEDDPYMTVPYSKISDGQTFEVGNVTLKATHTPGHTLGSYCFVGPGVVFSGDTLFPGGPGATHKSDSNFDDIIRSIDKRLFCLADDTVVLPGHGAPTTIGTEKPHLNEWIARGW